MATISKSFSAVILLLMMCSVLCAESLPVPCSQAYISSTIRTHVISSYNYPFNYQDLLNCTYRMYTETGDVTASDEICFRFARFDLELGRDFLAFFENGRSFVYSGAGRAMEDYSEPNRRHVWSDDFCFQTTDNILKITFTSDKTSTKRGFYARFWTKTTGANFIPDNQLGGVHIAGDVIVPNTTAPCFDPGQWTCFNRACISEEALCESSNSCGDWSDEMYIHAKCTTGSYGPSIRGCDFDHGHSCGFVGLANPGWLLDRKSGASNPDPDRIPTGDHTVGPYSPNIPGQFYVRTVFGDVIDDIDRLGLTDVSVTLDPNRTYCLSFWYHVTGPRVGRLKVILQPEADRPVWSRAANYSARWLHGQILIEHLNTTAQVFFEGVRSHDYNATFALDDIYLSDDEPCYTDDISCNFEFHFCGWTNQGDAFVRMSEYLTAGRIIRDPVSRTGEEYYAAFLANAPNATKLISPTWTRQIDNKYGACVEFWVYSNSTAAGYKLWTVDVKGQRLLMADLKPRKKTDADRYSWLVDTWKEVTIDVWSDHPFQIEIEAIVSSATPEMTAYLALDEVIVVEDGCHLIELQSCPLDMFKCSGSNYCIDFYLLCDGYNDCPDGSDEFLTACCYINKCPTGYFCCRNGNCVWSEAVCDGYNNCSDWTDELYCSVECDSDKFTCDDINMCISRDYLCDGYADCPGGSDENNCSLHPVALTVIIVVIMAITVPLGFRAMVFIRKRRGLRSGSDSEEAERTPEGEDAYADLSAYQQPPEYQECVNNPLYRKPAPVIAKRYEPDTCAVSPPSYEKVEEGQYETLTVPEKVAMQRLRRQIMSRLKDSRSAARDGSPDPGSGIGANDPAQLERDNRAFEASSGDDEARASVSRNGGLGIPKYCDLDHPPTYDNLSFCADGDDVALATGRSRHGSRTESGGRAPDPEQPDRIDGDADSDRERDPDRRETTANRDEPRESRRKVSGILQRLTDEGTWLSGVHRSVAHRLTKARSCSDMRTTAEVSSRDHCAREVARLDSVAPSDGRLTQSVSTMAEYRQPNSPVRIQSMPSLDIARTRCGTLDHLVLDPASLRHQTGSIGRERFNESCSSLNLSILPCSESMT